MAEDPDIDPVVFQDTMEALDGEIESKADSYATIISRLENNAIMVDTEIERLQAWKKSTEEKVTRMKTNLLEAMKATGKTKFKTLLRSYSVAKNPPAVVLETSDWHSVPAEYLREREPEIDKAKLKAALKLGVELPGVAHLEQGEGLRIR